MKKNLLLLTLFSFIFFFSCEQPLEEEEFPYELKLVIRGLIEEDELIDEIFIGRTLPVAVPFREDFAMLSDAVGAVVAEGVFYPLRHTGSGIYTTDSLVAQRGVTYTLLVQWQDKSITAETTVPVPGSVLSVGIGSIQEEGQTYNVLEGTINPFAAECYAATWVLVGFNGVISRESDAFAQVIKPENNQTIRVRTVPVPDGILNTTSGDAGLRLYVYDTSFYDYFISQGSNQIPDAIFGQPGSNVRWNVRGDGIGMFIGRIDIVLLL